MATTADFGLFSIILISETAFSELMTVRYKACAVHVEDLGPASGTPGKSGIVWKKIIIHEGLAFDLFLCD